MKMQMFKNPPIFDPRYADSWIGVSFFRVPSHTVPKMALFGPPPASTPSFGRRFSFNFLIESSLKMIKKGRGRVS